MSEVISSTETISVLYAEITELRRHIATQQEREARWLAHVQYIEDENEKLRTIARLYFAGLPSTAHSLILEYGISLEEQHDQP